MHVDVDEVRIARDGEPEHRMPVGGQGVGVGPAHGAEEQPVPDGPTVDHEVDVAGGAAVVGRQADMAGDREALARQVRPAAHSR